MALKLAIKPVLTFKTAKGSQYWVDERGRSQRYKSYHPEHGMNDQGLKNPYRHIIFVDNTNASHLVSAADSHNKYWMIIRKGKIGIVALSSEHQYHLVSGLFPYSDQPHIGFAPIEFNILKHSSKIQGYYLQKNFHIGNKIVEWKFVDEKGRLLNGMNSNNVQI
ncbi:hypothetical protein [Bacillus benzoevorans]|uniref:Uncharacterized protein n=1 Tax=Bacillus benzoevorans TaxID=1456 RepID=A0A7X0HXJ6_9BACI|nr:hypothetical protein [Bacillus benzoevorans]MBB6447440.1 hypothetical protein [Bacillus benzoevorans]